MWKSQFEIDRLQLTFEGCNVLSTRYRLVTERSTFYDLVYRNLLKRTKVLYCEAPWGYYADIIVDIGMLARVYQNEKYVGSNHDGRWPPLRAANSCSTSHHCR